MEYDAIHGLPQLVGLPQLEKQLIWNDIILLNAIGNERNKWCQLNGIGCNSWTSSIRGTIDLE